MIIVWGSPNDPPTAHMLNILRGRGSDVVHIDDRDLANLRYDVTFGGTPRGWIDVSDRRINLRTIDAMYLRPGSDRNADVAEAGASLLAVASSLDAIVVNRPTAGRSNLSKPFQLAAIAEVGLKVPPTIVTTDPLAARSFLDKHTKIVYKSISGIRSIVAMVDQSTAVRLAGVVSGPVQLQRFIEGIDVRVHVVGERCFATAIESTAVDYRYPSEGQGEFSIVATDLDEDIAERLVRLTKNMGLLVAGIDLRLTPDDEWVCFEVNSSPGFTFYEEAAGQPIAAAIADLMTSTTAGVLCA